MTPITHNGKKLFPVQAFLKNLVEGDKFKVKNKTTIYTVGEGNIVKDEDGKETYYPSRMPVLQLKAY